MAGRLAALVGVVLLVVPIHARQTAADASLSYPDIVSIYVRGDDARAWSEVSRWTRGRIERAIHALVDAKDESAIRSATMLHTDFAAYAAEDGPSATVDIQIDLAHQLVRALPRRHEFKRRWYAAAASMFLRFGDISGARRFVDEGRRAFGDDARLWLLTGTIDESDAALTRPPATPALPSRRDAAFLLAAAETEYRKAIALDSTLDDARLRLGHVLAAQKHQAEAREQLSLVLAKASEPRLLYLGHLFIGRIAHDADDFDTAAREFEAARAIDPDAQTAYVGLSDIAEHRGRHQEARQYIRLMTGTEEHEDAWWGYRMGEAGQLESSLAWLRQAVRP